MRLLQKGYDRFNVFTFSLIFFVLLLSGCNGTYSGDSGGLLIPNTTTQIEISFREHGYGNFHSKIIDSQIDFERFITNVKQQQNWNNKALFLNQLQKSPIDYSHFNLLLYRLTEGSGSIKLTTHKPEMIDGKAIVKIDKNIPTIGTGDMAYYLLAYEVAKNTQKLTFIINKKPVIIENKVSNKVVPKNCLTWFDGCNTCGRTVDNEIACTELACETDSHSYCQKWDK